MYIRSRTKNDTNTAEPTKNITTTKKHHYTPNFSYVVCTLMYACTHVFFIIFSYNMFSVISLSVLYHHTYHIHCKEIIIKE